MGKRLGALVVDRERHRTHPPQLREHLTLSRQLKNHDYKKSIGLIVECLKQTTETKRVGESVEDAASRTAGIECNVIGHVEDPNERKVLLLWTLASCLEGCGELRWAILLFSRCLQMDSANPIHAFHRGVCLQRVGSPSPACEDLDLAVSLCHDRDLRPPLIFLTSRALAGQSLPNRMGEVWNDFNLAWQLCNNPGLPLRLIYRRVQLWEEYEEMITKAVPPDGYHRHWAAVLVARCHKRSAETVSTLEALNFTRFVRGLKGIEFITQEILQKNLYHFGTRSVAEGSVILLEGYWYAVLSGSVDIVRFERPKAKGEYYRALVPEPAPPPDDYDKADTG